MEMNSTKSRFDTRESDLNRVDSINEFRTEAYMNLRNEMFSERPDFAQFTDAASDYLNALVGFYRVVKEHTSEETSEQQEEIEDLIDEVEETVTEFHRGEHRVEVDFSTLKDLEEDLKEIEDKINELRKDAGLSISQTDNTKEGEELL